MIVLDCLSIAYYDHRDAKAASQEGKLGGGKEGYGLWWPAGRGGDISRGVLTNCRLALLLWTFNNNKSQPSLRARQAIFTFYLPEKMGILPPLIPFVHFEIFYQMLLICEMTLLRRTFLFARLRNDQIIEEGADLIHF